MWFRNVKVVKSEDRGISRLVANELRQESLHIAAGEFYNTTSQFLSKFRMGFNNLKCKKPSLDNFFPLPPAPEKNGLGMFF
jgi:hypothetical protein